MIVGLVFDVWTKELTVKKAVSSAFVRDESAIVVGFYHELGESFSVFKRYGCVIGTVEDESGDDAFLDLMTEGEL